ncbi:EMBRYO DEFECTIVE 2734, (karyopherin enabling the transport of the cytoplasmic HYL1 [Hibiscus trionum]|uniref:EMBRYO DEFECTIVE 2734, (karyopherin enabling the transport of the cytoplasmic HYL1) n=1 Tax=Hibiscus trionum TaxID=183268 RepID=A0A9W7LI20_HIBTR|nr:EMBRYO DEFECTIVE 2734, (karyopherin enabling the transport of the cytoplasmic HYL1 [Hibiscus trionum]
MATDQTQLQIAQLANILGPDHSHFETLISHLLSPSNDQRSQAESLFNLAKQTHPDILSLSLSRVLSSSSRPELRALSAVLLRKILTPASDYSFLFPCLAESTQASIQSALLSSLQTEQSKANVKKLCDTISELASSVVSYEGWPELMPFLFQCVDSKNSNLEESALLIFARLAQNVGETTETLIPHLKTLHSVFFNCLSNPSSCGVRIAALSASVNFIQCISSTKDRDTFQDLLPLMIQTLNEALNSGLEATAQEALELLIDLAGTEPRFLRRQIVEVVGSILQIAEAERLEEGTRHLAIEFIVTLAEARERAPGMMRKLPQFIRRLFWALMNLLVDIEDEPDWYKAETEDEGAWETSNYGVGQECLDRLSISLGGNTVVPVASELLLAFLSAPEWQKRHAALIALAQIAEGCSKVMMKNLEHVVSMVLNSFQDAHPRVRWAAINAIGQLCTDLGPELQAQYHHRVLPALAAAMDDFQNPRVQAHAASAVLNFSENCTPDILTPYLDGIVSKLLVLLQNGKQMVQEGALTALASVADSSREQFQKYYDAVMPYLKAILVNANDKSNRMLRAKAMECISLVGMAVGKEKFRDDAKQVMEVLMSLQGSQMESDDPTTSYMLQAWARLCKCLGQDFLPYMSVVMPPLLQSAQLRPDVTITSADDEDDESIETITLGDKRIGIKTSVLEEKATACNMLCCYVDELKEGFFPWIDQVVTTLVPLLKFYFHEEVRKAAVSAMPDLLRSAKLAIEKGQSQGRNGTYMKQLTDYIVPALVEAIHKEPEVEICGSMLESLNECVEICGPFLDEGQIRCIVDEIKQVITASSDRKQERAERAEAEDFDADEGEMLKEENEQEEEVFGQVGELLGTLIKTFKKSFLPFFQELTSYIAPMWGKDKTAEERRIVICIFDDIAEHCRDAALKYYDTYLPFLLEACNDESPDVRQAAAFGVGLCAEFGGSVFKPLIPEALSRLNVVIRHPNALHSDNVMSYDNAVSALGKICQFHRDSIDAAQIVPTWLSCLPIKSDLMEAKLVHDQLCSMVERSDQELLGPNNQYLPKIVSVFAEVLCAGKDLATEQTASRMVNLIRHFQQSLPPSTWSSLQPQQQLALQSILSS